MNLYICKNNWELKAPSDTTGKYNNIKKDKKTLSTAINIKNRQ